MRNELTFGYKERMRTTSWTKTLALATFAFCIAFSAVQAQQRSPVKAPTSYFGAHSGYFIPKWKPDGKASARDDLNRLYDAPVFDKAEYDDVIRNLPYRVVTVPVAANEKVTVTSVQLEGREEIATNMFRESVKESAGPLPEWFPEQAVVPGPVVIRQGQHLQQLKIYPIQISANGDRMRKAKAVSYSLGRTMDRRSAAKSGARQSYDSESVLRNGTWYKIALTGEGLYKLDRDYLSGLGIDVNSVDPRRIQIFGNGGGMLPQTAGEYPYDDLEENAIVVTGEADGNFGAGDYVLFYSNGPHPTAYSDRLDRWWHKQNYYSGHDICLPHRR